MGKGSKRKKNEKPDNKKEKGRSKEPNHNINKNAINMEPKETKYYEQKKVAVSFKKLYQFYKEEEINTLLLEDLKKKASLFDLNPLLNYKLLLALKNSNESEYNKYIKKYKYTLNYEHAKELKCFKDNEQDLLNESLTYKFDIKKINSLSKIKLFNLLFYIMNLKFNEKQIDIGFINLAKISQEKILSYDNDVELIFKTANNYGNYELQYYTYLGLFVNYFNKKIELIFKEDEGEEEGEEEEENVINVQDNQINESPKEDVFFDWDTNYCEKMENIDNTLFKKGKNDLKNFIDKFISENININDDVQNMEIEKDNNDNKINEKKEKKEKKINKEKMNKDKETKENDDDKNIEIWKRYSTFHKMHVNKLKKYKNELLYLFKENNDEKILEEIEFIYFSLLFTSDKSLNSYDSYVNCLSNDPKLANNNFTEKYKGYL